MKLGHLLYAVLSCPQNRNAWRLKSRHAFVAPAQQLISSSNNKIRNPELWADHRWNAEWENNTTRLRTFIPDTGTHHPGMTLTRTAWIRLNRFRAGVGRFFSCLHKWGIASSVACECGAEEQTVDHVALECPIFRPPHGQHAVFPLWKLYTE